MNTDTTALDSLKGEENPRKQTEALLNSFNDINGLTAAVDVIGFYKEVHSLWYVYQQIEYNALSPELYKEKQFRQSGLDAARRSCLDRMVTLCLQAKGKQRRRLYCEFKVTINSMDQNRYVCISGRKALSRVPLWLYWGSWK